MELRRRQLHGRPATQPKNDEKVFTHHFQKMVINNERSLYYISCAEVSHSESTCYSHVFIEIDRIIFNILLSHWHGLVSRVWWTMMLSRCNETALHVHPAGRLKCILWDINLIRFQLYAASRRRALSFETLIHALNWSPSVYGFIFSGPWIMVNPGRVFQHLVSVLFDIDKSDLLKFLRIRT